MTAITPIVLRSDALCALHAAHPRRYPVLLQSAAQAESLGRFDILLAFPREHLTLQANGMLHTDADIEVATGFLATLDRWWMRERVGYEHSELPFTGGWFLFLGYELAGEIEPSLALPRQYTIAQAMRVPAAIVERRSDGAAWIVEENANTNMRQIIADLKALPPPLFFGPLLANKLHEEPEQYYLDAVRAALEHIAAGDIYQANLSRRWSGILASNAEPCDVYRRLRRANPAPFAALAVLDDRAIVSSSPERLIEVRHGIVATRPIAGTRPRGPDRSTDVARRMELHSNPKERAEHLMLIDLERSDLGRVCEPGSVEVDEFMTLESYAHVHHIVSNVRGRLRDGVTPGQTIGAVFPGGTITGCPKVRCMQIIAELERAARGAYSGSIGYLNRDGSMDLNILIRTLEIREREIAFRAGAGIVADSEPERELEETRAKARGLIAALGELMLVAQVDGSPIRDAEHALSIADRGLSYGDGLFETMLLRDGVVRFVAEHLARLQYGCGRLDIAMPAESTWREDIKTLTRNRSDGIVKLILTRGTGGRGYRALQAPTPTRIALLYPSIEHCERDEQNGIAVRWCATRLARNPQLAGIKHLNRLEQVLAQNEWRDAALAEGLMLDTEGEVISATSSNLFVVSEGVLATPDLRYSGVRGVMRQQVLAAAKRLAIETSECALRPDDVLSASEVFVTNAVRGIRPVCVLDARQWRIGSITQRLMAFMESAV